MRQHLPTDDHVIAENSFRLADLLIAAGASLGEEILQMEGAL